MLHHTTTNTMSYIKQYLHQLEVEEDYLWESYLDWLQDNQDMFNQLPQPQEVIGYED